MKLDIYKEKVPQLKKAVFLIIVPSEQYITSALVRELLATRFEFYKEIDVEPEDKIVEVKSVGDTLRMIDMLGYYMITVPKERIA